MFTFGDLLLFIFILSVPLLVYSFHQGWLPRIILRYRQLIEWGIIAVLICAPLASGIFYYLSSGAAETGVSSRSIALLYIFGFNFFLFGLIIFISVDLFKKLLDQEKIVLNPKLITLAFGIMLCNFMVQLGNAYDRPLIEKSYEQGMKLAKSISDFQSKKGRIPDNLFELSREGFEVPAPALKNSVFVYKPRKENNFTLSFASVAMLECRWQTEVPEWQCGDSAIFIPR